ncbi:MAG TPA: MBOAT family O-acyltransferase [Beijerinckiaceae bacterium]|nr:MBOAT family O-acyltransferase [Beijerinckiaceae bacterium]
MLFNSFTFLLVFLPAALLLHALVERFAPQWRLVLLVVLSFAFYGYWDWRFLPLLAASILVNWALAEFYWNSPTRALIPLAIAANLLVLGFLKYFNFFAELAAAVPGLPAARFDIVLPLGISFFTFHHIMYLADLRAGIAPRLGLVRYALYIAFFPQILAGPLVRWSEIVHQFDERPYARPDAAERVARGVMLLVVGLAKKVFLGDPLSEYVNPVFLAAAQGKAPSVIEAWSATLGFTFQIYFDFSGYTDMALGLALLFGIVLPQNFDAPYRATSLQDFWRRWHMTLSRFLRDYLYVPLGGSRHGLAVQLFALLATMALGGLWHGAGLTFVAWGVAHGLGLGAGVLWRKAGLRMPELAGWAITFAFVVLAWVLFRATTFESAILIYKALFGFAPLGVGFRWRTLALAAAVAIVGPTAWAAVHRLPPWRSIAVAFAILLVSVLLKIGDDANYEFIYFQF